MIRRFICLLLTAVMLLLISAPALATTTDRHLTVEEILNEYHQNYVDLVATKEREIGTISTLDSDIQLRQLKSNTLQKLEDAGYTAYDVTPSTFENVEKALKTDLDSMGLDSDNSYIVVVSGEENGISSTPSRSTAGPSFEFTYNGITHTMRYLTIYSHEDPHLTCSTPVTLVESKTATIIENALNAIISAIADNVAGGIPIGTILSICGLDLININTSQQTSFTYTASTSWTQLYTQIYTESSGIWLSWSFVEYATLYSTLDGHYYSIPLNRYTSLTDNECINYKYSEHYSDTAWRKQQAALGWTYSFMRRESTGDITYYYNGDAIITHFNYYG